MTSRAWTFTSYKIDKPTYNSDIHKFLIFQREKCPSTGREHWQGYVKYISPVRRTAAQKGIGDETCHMESAKGNHKSNVTYCTKDATRVSPPESFGEDTSQGERTDLKQFTSKVTNLSIPLTDTVLENPTVAIKYPRGTQLIRSMALQKASTKIRPDVKVKVLIGKPGSGKTRHIYDSHNINEIYKITLDGQSVWWDGYDGQKVLLIDDFESWLPYRFLLNILDIYPLRLPIKGGYCYANWEIVYITSNRPLECWYPGQPDKDALYRRIHERYEVSQSGGVILCPPHDITSSIQDETVTLN